MSVTHFVTPDKMRHPYSALFMTNKPCQNKNTMKNNKINNN